MSDSTLSVNNSPLLEKGCYLILIVISHIYFLKEKCSLKTESIEVALSGNSTIPVSLL